MNKVNGSSFFKPKERILTTAAKDTFIFFLLSVLFAYTLYDISWAHEASYPTYL